MHTQIIRQKESLWSSIKLFLFLMLCMGALLSPMGAYAAETQEEGSLDIGVLQERLKELGYFDTSPTFRYDLSTQLALKRCCEENALPFSDKSIPTEAYYAIMTRDDIKPKPERVQYQYLSAGSEGQGVLDLQLRLKELGYFTNLVYTACLYDDATQKAVELFCIQNGLSVSLGGASENIQYVLYSDSAEAFTPPKELIALGSGGQSVIDLQLRLKELGYFDGQLGIYDADTHSAVELFCNENNLIASADSVDENVQYVLFSNTAIAYTPPVPPSFLDKLGGFLQARVIGVPLWVIFVTILIYAITFSVLLMRILGSKRKRKTNEPETPIFSLGEAKDQPNKVDLSISFDGEKKRRSIPIDHPITIGRRNADIQLDLRDKRISRIHGRLEKRGDQIVYFDTSANGTNINEIFVHKNEYPIHDGDRLQISKHTIQIFL